MWSEKRKQEFRRSVSDECAKMRADLERIIDGMNSAPPVTCSKHGCPRGSTRTSPWCHKHDPTICVKCGGPSSPTNMQCGYCWLPETSEV